LEAASDLVRGRVVGTRFGAGQVERHEEVLSEEGKGGGVFTMAASPSAAHRPWSPSVRGRRTHPARRGSCGRGKMGRGPHGRRRRGPCTLAAVRRDKGPWP